MCGKLSAKFGKYNHEIGSCVEATAQTSTEDAVEEAVKKNINEHDLTVALDGSWWEGDTHSEWSCHSHLW